MKGDGAWWNTENSLRGKDDVFYRQASPRLNSFASCKVFTEWRDWWLASHKRDVLCGIPWSAG